MGGSINKWAFIAQCGVQLALFAAPRMDLGNGQMVLEEDYDENYEPTVKGKLWLTLQTNVLANEL